MNGKTALALLLGTGLLGALGGCSGSTAAPSNAIDVSRATLRRAASCEDLSSALRDDARAKVNRRVDAEIRAIREGLIYGAYGYGTAVSEAAPSAANGAAGAAADSSKSASPAPAHSDTETQVKGVDEADIVKTDGNHIYLLHGNKFLIVDSWPAANLATLGSADIEGEPLEMFVADGRVVVFSRVDGTPIYSAAGTKPRPAYNDGSSSYGYYGGGDMRGGAPAAGAAGVATPYPGGGPVSSSAPLTKVTVLSLAGTQASVARELYFEGSYVSSRRVDGRVRVILGGGGHGPQLEYSPQYPQPAVTASGSYAPPTASQQIDAWEQLRQKDLAKIDSTSFADWVPASFSKDGGAVAQGATGCSDYYVPTPGTTSYGMTQIASIDLDAPTEAPRVTSIVGEVATVYGNTNALVLSGNAFVDPWVMRENTFYASGAKTVNGTPFTMPVTTMNYTHLHVFDIGSDPTTATYAGSGTVPGSVKDQFALDEKNGVVRVTTTEQRTGPARPDGKSNEVSHVYALENHQGQLTITGDAGEIAPGEQLYATRYVGDKAYVVTWHVTDPLFVVDVADSHHVQVMGQVQIPGFSTYMHPLDDTHLLTIGRETDMTGHQHNGSYWYGLAIQIFDVTNPTAPTLQHKFVFDGGEYATSEAMDNHKAFTYFDDKKLLAFPYVRQSGYGTYQPSSTLQVFKAGVAEGITQLGSVDHTSLLGTLPSGGYGYCGGYFDGAVRRGVFVENVVYSISYGGIVASDVSAVATPVNTLKLAAPTMPNVCAN